GGGAGGRTGGLQGRTGGGGGGGGGVDLQFVFRAVVVPACGVPAGSFPPPPAASFTSTARFASRRFSTAAPSSSGRTPICPASPGRLRLPISSRATPTSSSRRSAASSRPPTGLVPRSPPASLSSLPTSS